MAIMLLPLFLVVLAIGLDLSPLWVVVLSIVGGFGGAMIDLKESEKQASNLRAEEAFKAEVKREMATMRSTLGLVSKQSWRCHQKLFGDSEEFDE